MNSIFKKFLIGAFVCTFSFSAAQAEIFVIEDQNDRFSITFPDSWDTINNQKSDDKITIAAPGQYDFATCRMRVRKDGRFKIFPAQFDDTIQKLAYSREFWDDYLGDYNDINIDAFKDEAGLGLGHASMVEVAFETSDATVVRKRGLMFATLYHDTAYIIDCSAEESAFMKWRPDFLSIVKSVDFVPVRDRYSSGHYRNFPADEELVIEGPYEMDVYKF